MNIKKAEYRYYGSETEPNSIRVELNDSNIESLISGWRPRRIHFVY